jgi:hypothetical protein
MKHSNFHLCQGNFIENLMPRVKLIIAYNKCLNIDYYWFLQKKYLVGDSLQCDLPLAIKKILIITSFGRVSFLDETIAHFGKVSKQNILTFFETSIGVPSKIWGCPSLYIKQGTTSCKSIIQTWVSEILTILPKMIAARWLMNINTWIF